MKKVLLLFLGLFLVFGSIGVSAIKTPSYVNIDSGVFYADPVVATTSGVVYYGNNIYIAYLKDINYSAGHTYTNEIWLASSYNNGLTFSKRKIIDAGSSAYGIERLDLIADKDGYLHLVFFHNANGEYYSYSINSGLTWSAKELITASTGTYGVATIDVNNFESNYLKRARIFREGQYYSRKSGSWASGGIAYGIMRGFVSQDKNVYAFGSASPSVCLYNSQDDGTNWSSCNSPNIYGISEHGGIYQKTDKNIIGTITTNAGGGTYYREFFVFKTDENSFAITQLINANIGSIGDIFDNNVLGEYIYLLINGTTIKDYRANYGANLSSFEDYNLQITVNRAKIVKNSNNMGVIANIGSDLNLVYFKIPTPNANLTNHITESSDPAYNDSNFQIYNDLRRADLNTIVESADCNIIFAGTIYDMPYSSSTQKYVFDFREPFPNTYPYQVNCEDANYNNSSTDGNITIQVNYAPYLTITDIENVTHNTINTIKFYPSDESKQIIYKVDSSYPASLGVTYNIENSLNDFRQYYVYVANPYQYDLGQWTFSDLLTYGSSSNYDDAIQKIWDNSLQKYVYSFNDSLISNETKYYKLVYRYPMRFWGSLNSDEWTHQLVPQNYTWNGINWDKYSVSVYSNILSKFKIFLPDVTSVQPYAYELQFNAYSDSATSVTVGVYSDSNYGFVSSKTVNLTTTQKRYSIDVQANDVNQYIYIKSNSTTANNIYFSNVILEQRAYFKTRLELLKENFEELPVFITDINGLSYKYIDEGTPFRFKTQIYDRDAKVRTERVQVFAYGTQDTNKVYQQDFNITNYDVENTINLSDLINGIVLIKNGDDYFTRTPILVKVQLIDEYGYAFEEIGTWIKMHEFPFFNTDFFLMTREDTRTLNTAPKGKIFLQSRIPSNIESVEMYIYYGNYICPKWRAGTSGCNADNTATDSNLAFRYTFYKNDSCDSWNSNEAGCFTCNNANDCSFEYNLENKFHFAGNGFHTTFTLMHFNTTDTNVHFSRTVYEIGQQTLKIISEVQGLDYEAYKSCDGNRTMAGTPLGGLFVNEIDVYNAILGNTVVQQQIYSGKITYADVNDFAYNFCGQSYGGCAVENFWFNFTHQGLCPKGICSNPLMEFLNWSGCSATINQNTNLKIVVRLYSSLLDDFHSYEKLYFKITPCEDDNVTCDEANEYSTKFYPTMSYYNIKDGSNVFVWNTILYDENANYLQNGKYYRIDFWGLDGTYRNKQIVTRDSGDGNFLVEIDNAFNVSNPAIVSWLPINLSATSKDQLYLRSFLATQNKYIDKIEFVLYTDYSSYDSLKSDKENQIIRFNLDSEQLQKLKSYLDFNVYTEFNKFKFEHQNADFWTACLSGGAGGGVVGGGLAGLLIGTGIVALPTGFGTIPAMALIGGGALLGALTGCGGTYGVSWALSNAQNVDIDRNYNFTKDRFNANEFKEVDLTFTNLHVNDYSELLKANNLKETETSESTIINDLAKKGKKAYSNNLIINVAGKKYEFENVLVGNGTLNDNIISNNLKLRINVYWDYFTKNSINDLEISSLQTPPTDWLTQLSAFFIMVFNNYAILVLGLVLIVVMFVFLYRGLRG